MDLAYLNSDQYKFSILVKDKLIKANKSLYLLGKFRGDGYKQPEIDYMFNSIPIPNIRYGLLYMERPMLN